MTEPRSNPQATPATPATPTTPTTLDTKEKNDSVVVKPYPGVSGTETEPRSNPQATPTAPAAPTALDTKEKNDAVAVKPYPGVSGTEIKSESLFGALSPIPIADVKPRPESEPKHNALFDLQSEHQGRFVEYAGYYTPMCYRAGIVQEHLHTRTRASLFDVSHMNQLTITGGEAAWALEQLMPKNLVDLKIGRSAYTVLTNDNGGIIDDLIITRLTDEEFYLVSNAKRAEVVNAHFALYLPGFAEIKRKKDYLMLALQGPQSLQAITPIAEQALALKPMHGCPFQFAGETCYITRSGYSGEIGFELSIPSCVSVEIASLLVKNPAVEWAGLGARDSLRLEAGLYLYGQDLDETITPVEAGLTQLISPDRQIGERANFLGAPRILGQLNGGALQQKIIGLSAQQRRVARKGTPLYQTADTEHASIGHISSGGYSPTLKCSIAMAIVSPAVGLNSKVYARLPDKFVQYQTQNLPFYSRFKT